MLQLLKEEKMVLVNFHCGDENSVELDQLMKDYEGEMEFASADLRIAELFLTSLKYSSSFSPCFVIFKNGRRVHFIPRNNEHDLRPSLSLFLQQR